MSTKKLFNVNQNEALYSFNYESHFSPYPDFKKEARVMSIMMLIFVCLFVVAIFQPFPVKGVITGTVVSASYNDFIYEHTKVEIASYNGNNIHFTCYGNYTDKFVVGSVYKISWVIEPFKFGVYTIKGITKTSTTPGLFYLEAV